MRTPHALRRVPSSGPARASLALVLLVPALALELGACSARGGPGQAAERPEPPQRYDVVVRNDNFLDARLHLVYRTGNRHPLGVARAYATTRLETPADVLLHDEFRLLLDLIGGPEYLVPDLLNFPLDAVRLEVEVRPVLEQSHASIR